MKKVLFIVLILFFFLEIIFLSAFLQKGFAQGNTQNSIPIPSGIFIESGNPAEILARAPGLKIGVEFVNEVGLTFLHREEFNTRNEILTFAPLNPFYFLKIDKKPLNFEDAKYLVFNSPSLYERDFFRTFLVSFAKDKNGKPFIVSKKAEPVMETWYEQKYVQGRSALIPKRILNKREGLFETYFFLDYKSRIENERLSAKDFYTICDINPAKFQTLINRKNSDNPLINFQGFYVNLPDEEIIDEFYIKNYLIPSINSLQKTLKNEGKLLALKNITSKTFSLINSADFIGLKIKTFKSNVDDELLKDFKKSLKGKVGFVELEADFENLNLKDFLDKLLFYGLYSSFIKDLKTYKNYFQDELYLKNIKILSLFSDNLSLLSFAPITKFTAISEQDNKDLLVNKIGDFPKLFFTVRGNGLYKLQIDKEKFHLNSNISFYLENEKKFLSAQEFDTFYEVPLEIKKGETKLIRVASSSFMPLILENTSRFISYKGSVANVKIINQGVKGDEATFEVFYEGEDKPIYSSKINLKPLETKSLSFPVKNVENANLKYTLKFKNSSLSFSSFLNYDQKNGIIFSIITLFGIFVLISFFLLKIKNLYFGKLNNKWILILIPYTLIILNSLFVHYSLRTMAFFISGIMFLLFYLKEKSLSDKKIFLISSIIMFFSGLLFNLIEYKTFFPHFENILMPFYSFEEMFFCLIFILIFLTFTILKGKSLNILELLIIILPYTLLLILSSKTKTFLLFPIDFTRMFPLLLFLFLSVFLSLFKVFGIKKILFTILPVGTVFLIPYFSNFFDYLLITKSQFSFIFLPLRYLILFTIPLLVLLFDEYNRKKTEPQNKIGIFTFSLFLLLFIFLFFFQYSVKINAFVAIDYLAIILNVLILTFLITVLVDLLFIAKKEKTMAKLSE